MRGKNWPFKQNWTMFGRACFPLKFLLSLFPDLISALWLLLGNYLCPNTVSCLYLLFFSLLTLLLFRRQTLNVEILLLIVVCLTEEAASTLIHTVWCVSVLYSIVKTWICLEPPHWGLSGQSSLFSHNFIINFRGEGLSLETRRNFRSGLGQSFGGQAVQRVEKWIKSM